MDKFKVIIVEDVPLELKGTEGIIRNDIPEARIVGTAENEPSFWKLLKADKPDLVLLDLGLGGSTTIGVEICRHTKESHPDIKVLIFTGEILNEKLWVDVLDAGCDGIILKSGELLTRGDVASVMGGKKMVFNQPIMEKIVERFKRSVNNQIMRQEALVNYEIAGLHQGADHQSAGHAFRREEPGETAERVGAEALSRRQWPLGRQCDAAGGACVGTPNT